MSIAGPKSPFLSFADEIDEFYRGVFRYKTRCAFARYPTIDVTRAAVDVYLRFRPGGSWPADSVVIARIGFRDMRRGHGTALLHKLVDLSDRYGLKWLAIEQTGSHESINNFVRKFGFTNHNGYAHNWVVQIEQLRSLLATLPPAQPRRRRAAGRTVG